MFNHPFKSMTQFGDFILSSDFQGNIIFPIGNAFGFVRQVRQWQGQPVGKGQAEKQGNGGTKGGNGQLFQQLYLVFDVDAFQGKLKKHISHQSAVFDINRSANPVFFIITGNANL